LGVYLEPLQIGFCFLFLTFFTQQMIANQSMSAHTWHLHSTRKIESSQVNSLTDLTASAAITSVSAALRYLNSSSTGWKHDTADVYSASKREWYHLKGQAVRHTQAAAPAPLPSPSAAKISPKSTLRSLKLLKGARGRANKNHQDEKLVELRECKRGEMNRTLPKSRAAVPATASPTSKNIPLIIRVENYQREGDHVCYTLMVTQYATSLTWVVKRRFREFAALCQVYIGCRHYLLCVFYSKCVWQILHNDPHLRRSSLRKCLACPRKQITRMSRRQLEQRRQDLDKLMSSVSAVSSFFSPISGTKLV
jgi:hypothetical protein